MTWLLVGVFTGVSMTTISRFTENDPKKRGMWSQTEKQMSQKNKKYFQKQKKIIPKRGRNGPKKRERNTQNREKKWF